MSRHRKKPPWTVFLGLISLFVVGIGLLFVLSEIRFNGADIFWEFGRDLGIALIVSGVVASLFELYRSIRHHIETMRDVIDITMGEQITPEVWLELKEVLETRKVIRRNMHIRWSLTTDPSLQNYEAVLQIEQEYELHALNGRSSRYSIEHELDYQLTNETLRLPRFERVIIDPPGEEATVCEGEELAKKFPNGKLKIEVSLQRRGDELVRVRVERHELVNVPGAYNLYTPEFTKGLHIYYGDCPTNIDPEISVRPLGHGLRLKHVGNNWSCEHLLLPGQGIEIKFLQAARATQSVSA